MTKHVISLTWFCSLISLLPVFAAPQAPTLRGVISLGDGPQALLMLSPPGRTEPRYVRMGAGQALGDLRVLSVDMSNETVQVQNGEQEMTLKFDGVKEPQVASAKQLQSHVIRLQDCPLRPVVQLYAQMRGRSALQHPALKPESFTLRITARTKDDASRELERAMEHKGITSKLEGEKFMLLVPTATVSSASTHSFGIALKPLKLGEKDLIPPGLLQLTDMQISQVIELYSQMAGRTFVPNVRLRARPITFRNETALTRADALRALDTLLDWNGVKLVSADNNTIKAIPNDEPIKP